jgi:DNA helicase II / ATP-dependent DNA helicase PcrA
MKQYRIKEASCQSGDSIFSIPYGEVLNPAQYEAVTTLHGPLLVVAGAGSGKTRTLTYRVARLVEVGISPGSILLLTFTRRASQDMLRRAASLLDHRCEKVAGGTFHSFANATLRRYATLLGFETGFSILDRADSEDIINLVRTRLKLNFKERRFPRKRTIAGIFSKAVNKGLSVEDVVFDDYSNFVEDVPDLLRLHGLFEAYKQKHGLLDYDDLLIYMRRLIQDHKDVREKLSRKYQYVMVDEYQDTNKIQADIVQYLGHSHNNVMVVGDDSQCVYAFRGANFGNIMDFPRVFPGARIIKLEENYRSTQPILDLTNVIIDRATKKYAKVLFTRKQGGVRPVLIKAGDERTQSRFVVQRILELREQGVPLDDMAVLFRSGFHAFDLEIELNRANIPFVKVGGFKFMETAHIKDVLAHMKVLANPNDSVSWHRILLLLDAIGPKAADAIFQDVAASGKGVAGLAAHTPSPRYEKGFARLKKTLADLDAYRLSVAEIGAGFVGYYEPYLKKKFDNYPKRIKDLEHLVAIMERYEDLEKFLSDMALEPPSSSVDDILATDYDDEKLVLSTIHSAKGLEWNTVFVIWALEGRFPTIYAVRSEEEMEEELRLMYVAASRAEENLYFTYPINIYDRGTAMVLGRPSRFIENISEDILEPWSLTDDYDDPYTPWE